MVSSLGKLLSGTYIESSFASKKTHNSPSFVINEPLTLLSMSIYILPAFLPKTCLEKSQLLTLYYFWQSRQNLNKKLIYKFTCFQMTYQNTKIEQSFFRSFPWICLCYHSVSAGDISMVYYIIFGPCLFRNTILMEYYETCMILIVYFLSKRHKASIVQYLDKKPSAVTFLVLSFMWCGVGLLMDGLNLPLWLSSPQYFLVLPSIFHYSVKITP